MMAWIYSPETWNNKRMHWLEKDCHFVVPVGWAHCYGIAGADAGNGPEIFLFLGSQVGGKWDRQEFRTPHKMDEKKWHHVVGSYDGETMKIYVAGKGGRITHRFEEGTRFKLGATGNSFSGEGKVNSFLATISIEAAL